MKLNLSPARSIETEGVHQAEDSVPLLDQILAMCLNDDAQSSDNREYAGENEETDSSCQSDLEEIL